MFTGNEDHNITLNEGAAMTKLYRQTISAGEILGGFFGIQDMRDLLNQPGCVGFRYYYGFNTAGEKVLVLVGTDAYENDLVDGLLMERAYPCPPHCGTGNVLNSD